MAELIATDRVTLSLSADGWEPGATNREVEEMDREIVEGNGVLRGMRCKCGGRLEYHPFHREREYRAVIVCPRCGERGEL